jgi:hypothetical protein
MLNNYDIIDLSVFIDRCDVIVVFGAVGGAGGGRYRI